jgi:hypothetical protein
VTWPQFAADVERERPDAVTVDVYDTCVVRQLLGDQPIEEVAGRWSEHLDDDGQPLGYDRAAALLERDLCRPVPDAVQSLDRIRSVVGSVVFISDTDRSSALLTELLESHDLFRSGDRVVASCEQQVTKSDGDLYDLIWTVRPSTVWHVGNNNWSDGSMAAAHGYQPFDLPHGNPTRYEAALADNPGGLGPMVAAAARAARLELESDFEPKPAERDASEQGRFDERCFYLRRVGAQVAGPVMTAFAFWIGQQVREHGLDHLGFLARDGELPKLIADRVPDRSLRTADRSYVHLNRLTITLAMAATVGMDTWVREGTADDAGFLVARQHLISYGGLLQRIGFEPGDVADVVGSEFPLTSLDPSAPVPSSHTGDWLRLLNDQSAQELILARASQRRQAVVDYFHQLGLLTASRPAFVDVGWSGRLARLLNVALAEYFVSEPIHLHFGGDLMPPEVREQVRIYHFAFPGSAKIPPFDKPGGPVETLTASGSPRVIGHRRNASGLVEPVFEDETVEVGQAGRAELWRGALAMADRLPDIERVESWGLRQADLAAEAREVLRLWWFEPDRNEAEAMLSFAFEGDEAGAQVIDLLAPYELTDAFGDQRSPRQWREGSRAVSSLSSKVGLEAAMLGRRVLGR